MSDPTARQPEVPALEPRRVRDILGRAHGSRVIVLGDMVLDEQIVGRAQAVAREAPVLIIRQDSRYAVPGGATNVAANLGALGCEVGVLRRGGR